MGITAAVLHPAQQQRGAIREKRRAGVEDTIDLVWPVGGCQDRVAFVELK
jgi:hypothetical protein